MEDAISKDRSMTTESRPASQQVESIKTDLQSPSSTSQQTLNLLRAVLGFELQYGDNSTVPAASAKQSLKSAKPRAKINGAPRRPPAKKPTEIPIHEDSPPKVTSLDSKSQRTIATDVFNTALKTLSNAAKVRQERTKPTSIAISKPSKRQPPSPLRESSPNRQAKPNKNKAASREDSPLDATIECATTALQCLRKLGTDTKSPDAVDLRLEQGALVLLDKTITLDLVAHAERQLRTLHEQYWKRRKASDNATRNDREGGRALAPLLVEIDNDRTVFKFAASLQSNWLRLAILKGSKWINKQTVNLLKPETAGSPAWAILEGLRLGLLDNEACGTHLRTISLAMTKLHKVSVEESASIAPDPAFSLELVCSALRIKAYSWKYLGHQPHLQVEFWTPIHLSMQCYDTLSKASSSKPLLQSCLKSLVGTLAELGFTNEAPPEVRSLSEQRLSGAAGNPDQLGEQMGDLSLCETVDDLLVHLDAIFACLEAYPNMTEEVEQSLEQLRKSIHGQRSLSRAKLTQIFFKIARLRKSLLGISSAIEQDVSKAKVSQSDLQLQVGCIRTLHSFVSLVLRCLRQSSPTKPQPPKQSRKRRNEDDEDDLLLTYAKTVEAAISVEQFAITRSPLLSEEAKLTLSRVLEIAALVQNSKATLPASGSTRAFFEGIPVRISQTFWGRYLWLTEHRRPVSERVQALQASVDAVQQRSLSERQGALLNLKYEKSAALLEETKSHSRAIEVCHSGIKLCLELGALPNAVEAFLLGSSDSIWSNTKSSFFTLGTYLASYARLRLQTCNSGSRFAFDQEHLPSLHRFVMMERQIVSVLTSALPVTKEQLRDAIQHAWVLLDQQEHLQHRLYFTTQMLFLLERSQRWKPSDFFTYEAIRYLTVTIEDNARIGRGPLVSMLRQTLSVQWTLITGSLNEDLVTSLVANLKSHFGLEADSEVMWKSSLHVRILSQQLLALGDFAGVLGDDRLQLDIWMMLRMLQQHGTASDPCQQLKTLIQVGVLHNRLDNTSGAGKAFAKAEKQLAELEDQSRIRMFWSLGYAEYLLNIDNVGKCIDILHKAQTDYSAIQDSAVPSGSRIERDTAICRAAYLASKLSFHRGRLGEAVDYAKQAARLSTALWISIEKRFQDQPINHHEDSSVHILVEEVSNPTLSTDQPPGQPLKGAKFWSTITLHRQTLSHIAFLFSHLGLYQDALYYAQEVYNVSHATAGRFLSSSCSLDLALLRANAGNREHARAKLLSACSRALQDHPLIAQARDLLTAGEICILLQQHNDAEMYLRRLHDLKPPWLKSRIEQSGIPDSNRRVTPKKTSVKNATGQRGKQAKNQGFSELSDQKPNATLPTKTISQAEMATRTIALENSIRQCQELLDQNSDVECPSPSTIGSLGPLATVSNAIVLLRHALRSFSVDPANNTLTETTLAMPVRYKSTRKSGQMSLLLEESTMLTPKLQKVSRAPNSLHLSPSLDVSALGGPQLLRLAFETLQKIDVQGRCSLLPSSVVTLMHKALSQITLMSAAVAVPLEYSTSAVVLQSFFPKEICRRREQYAIHAESATMSLDNIHLWPQLTVEERSQGPEGFRAELNNFLHQLPHSWSIVSVGLSQDSKELLLSRIEAGGSPFLMRVPLGRPDLEGSESHDFTFDYARAELMDIIKQADASSHDERGQGDKQARGSWYAEREALDRRLKTLLVNMENIWLGGFRGLLVSKNIDGGLLSRFSQSMSQSLDKYLPSRQKASKSPSRVDLHARVLELFTALPFEDSNELEDSITDLLYFVIDILQFNGEPNAYDEIDFDAILVDVLEALRAHHAAYSSGPNFDLTRHTILIVDKELEAFPWESLPCMQGRPVSRMPSLGAIKERLDLIHAQSTTINALSIPADKGAYILNPSSDLTSTQQTFEPTFTSQLPTFSSLINTSPTETQFETFLTQYPLLLYFGHGSGAQYILKRKIRRLQKCAVTWLMGCSSAKMTECGNFESYGMPNNYVHGGSPAVVGTLWDVTDRDLDRCAMRALGVWGLVDEPEPDAEGGKAKVKGKARAKKGGKKAEEQGKEDKWKGTRKEERRGEVALDEAVAAGREACRLRYLNGAAVVVYGVPVVLE